MEDKSTLNNDDSRRQITSSLKKAFSLSRYEQHQICTDQKCNEIEIAIDKWLLETLVRPNYQLGKIIMPILSDRFGQYLQNLNKRSQ